MNLNKIIQVRLQTEKLKEKFWSAGEVCIVIKCTTPYVLKQINNMFLQSIAVEEVKIFFYSKSRKLVSISTFGLFSSVLWQAVAV